MDYKISLVPHHHPTIRPTLLEIVTMAKAPATPFSLLTSNPYALCINFSVSSFLEVCLGVKVSPIWQHVTLRPLAPSPCSPKEFWTLKPNYSLKKKQGFPGGAVVENLPANAGDMGLSPGPGRSHMPRSKWAHEPQLLSLRVWSLCSATREAAIERGPRTAMKSGPRLPQLEEALVQKRRSNTAITN